MSLLNQLRLMAFEAVRATVWILIVLILLMIAGAVVIVGVPVIVLLGIIATLCRLAFRLHPLTLWK